MGKPATLTPRCERRLKVFRVVELDHRGDRSRGHIINISSAGALVHTAEPFALGALVDLQITDCSRRTRVVWRSDRYVGIKFLDAIDDQVLMDIVTARD